jgi:cell wall-associated NlpC family hydrolase
VHLLLTLLLFTAPIDDDEASAEPAGSEGDADELPEVTAARSTLIAEARRELAAVKSSHYVHRTQVDEPTGRFDFDCSGFVGYALARAAPEAYAELHRFAGRRPLATDFVSLAAGNKSAQWTRVASVESLAPGDLIAWTRPADVVSRNTGHVMVVDETPRRTATGEWEIPIVDSTAAPHGKRDLRKQSHQTGLGRGVVVLSVGEQGAPLGYRWSTWSKSKLHSTQIVLLRPVRGFSAEPPKSGR